MAVKWRIRPITGPSGFCLSRSMTATTHIYHLSVCLLHFFPPKSNPLFSWTPVIAFKYLCHLFDGAWRCPVTQGRLGYSERAHDISGKVLGTFLNTNHWDIQLCPGARRRWKGMVDLLKKQRSSSFLDPWCARRFIIHLKDENACKRKSLRRKKKIWKIWCRGHRTIAGGIWKTGCTNNQRTLRMKMLLLFFVFFFFWTQLWPLMEKIEQVIGRFDEKRQKGIFFYYQLQWSL